MKNIVISFCFLLVACVLLSSCDKRKDFYASMNLAPKIEMRKQGTYAFKNELNDSIKKMFRDYFIDLNVIDEEELALNYSISGADKFVLTNGVGKFSPDTMKLGTHKIVFVATDNYNVTTTATATFEIFDNLPPIAACSTLKLAIHDPLEYNIDASTSYDRDSKYGGTIVEYEFSINTTYKVNTQFNNIHYIFPASGNYTVNVRVKDNNGAWSASKGIILAVN